MRVRVFRNLTSGCLSLQAKVGGGWRTVAHATDAVVAEAVLHVSEAGRQRVLASGKKQVHAWVEGVLRAWAGVARPAAAMADPAALHALRAGAFPAHDPALAVTYNPRRVASFVSRATGAPVRRAALVALGREGVTAHGVEQPPCPA